MSANQQTGTNPLAGVHCPLCGRSNIFVVRRFGTERLRSYWEASGYDLYKNFPQLSGGMSKCQCVDCDVRFFLPRAAGGPDLYSALGRSSVYYPAAKWEYEHVLRHLSARQKGGSLLEFGCGPGVFLQNASPYFDRAVGLDFNEAAVSEARGRGLDVRAAGLETLNETFDTIVAFQVIEHVPDPGETLRQLASLLKPGGELIVAVPNEDGLLGALEWNCLNMPPHHATCWTRRAFEWAAVLTSLKLERYSVETLGLDLYLGSIHERFDRYLTGGNILMRFMLWPIRRAAIAYALVSYEDRRRDETGHTHIAFFRKPSGSA